MSKMNVEVLRGRDELINLQSEWQELACATKAAPFLSWEWVVSWHRCFGRSKEPVIICVREGRKLVGLLGLCEEKKKLSPFGSPARVLTLMGGPEGAPDYLDMIALPGYKHECGEAIFDHLAQSDLFDLLLLENMPADSETIAILCWKFPDDARSKFKLIPENICPQVDLRGGWEQVMKESKHPHNFKRRLRKISSHEGFEYRVVTEPDRIDEALERFLRLHEMSWAHRGGSSAIASNDLRSFFYEAMPQLSRAGMARFDEIWVEGDCRASNMGFNNGETHYFYLPGYDPAWRSFGVGQLIFGLAFEDLAKRGVKWCDFLRGAESYKFDWSSSTRATVTAQLLGNDFSARYETARRELTNLLRLFEPEWLKIRRRRLRKEGLASLIASPSQKHDTNDRSPEDSKTKQNESEKKAIVGVSVTEFATAIDSKDD